MANNGPSFPRAPLTSAPAKSTITKLQVTLNNLSSQVCEAVYVVAETAPPLSFNPTVERDKLDLAAQSRTNFEIVKRAQQIATIVQVVEKLIDELPDSSKTQRDAESEIIELQRLNDERSKELRRLTKAVRQIQIEATATIETLTEELRIEERNASVW